jgi:glycosyltransferase involved in cell wall biosynthesis
VGVVGVRNEKNLRISGTLNRGISLARGEFIARMDADDWSYPDRFQKQIRYMEEHPEVVISGGSMEMCSGNLTVLNERKYHLSDRDIRAHLFRYSPFCHATTMYRREQVQKIGGYNVDLADAEDYDLYFRIGKMGEFANMADILFKVRTHGESMSRVRARRQESLTLYIRVKAIMEYGYSMTLGDKLYLLGQFISMYLIPSSLKFWVFNFIRSV